MTASPPHRGAMGEPLTLSLFCSLSITCLRRTGRQGRRGSGAPTPATRASTHTVADAPHIALTVLLPQPSTSSSVRRLECGGPEGQRQSTSSKLLKPRRDGSDKRQGQAGTWVTTCAAGQGSPDTCACRNHRHSDYGDQKHRRLGRRDSALPVVRSSTPGGVIVYHVNLTGRLHGRREKHRDLLVTSHGSRQAGGIGWETCSSTAAGAKSDTS